jgi:hypothetical protein
MPVIAVPIELHRNFLANRTEFLRNLACWPMTALKPFYRRTQPLFEAIMDRENPWDYVRKRFPDDFICQDPSVFRYMHFDLSENRDRCGFAMCSAPFHVVRDITIGQKVEEMRVPHIYFDFLGIIEVSKGDELDFQLIPEIVFELRRRGFVIDLVTFDRFQSTMIMQMLSGEGLHCGKLSIDRTAFKIIIEKVLNPRGETKGWKLKRESTEKQYSDAHQSLKAAIQENRASIPAWTDWIQRHTQEPQHPFIAEALGAEIQDAGCVDHGPFSSIDLLSGMAGACYNCSNNAPDLGDKPAGYEEGKFYGQDDIHQERMANFRAIQEALSRVSTIDQFQAVMNATRDDDFSDVDMFSLEHDENNPFRELGL